MNFYRADSLPQPPVALMQWQNEINEYTDGKLRVLIHHNSNPKIKNMKLKELRGFDIIMISYSGLESVYRKESKGWKRDDGLIKENSKIHAIKYHRLILDEAHNIKTRTTGGMNTHNWRSLICLLVFSRQGLLRTRGRPQVVPFWYPCTKPHWGILFTSTLSSNYPFCMLLLQEVPMC